MTAVLLSGVYSCFFVWLIYRRSSQVVAASSPRFLGLMLVGAIIGCWVAVVDLFRLNADPGSTTPCVATHILEALAFSMMFAGIFSRVLRLNLIFNSRGVRKIVLHDSTMLYPIAGLILFEVGIAIAWYIYQFVFVAVPNDGFDLQCICVFCFCVCVGFQGCIGSNSCCRSSEPIQRARISCV